MGYACPVCEDPQADGEHLANHLAFTAMLGDDAHEAWLDERVPDWGDRDPASLAADVVDYADEREFPQVFEDTTDTHDHQEDADSHARGVRATGADDRDGFPEVADAAPPDGDAVPSDVLVEARELTRERRERADPDGSGDAADGDGADVDDAADEDEN